MGIKENYLSIQEQVPTACVVAVTKYVGPEKIIEAYNAGIRNFGENRLQDAEKKRELLPEEVDNKAIWHFLGHIQTNKAKKIVGNYQYIHSVDSIKLAQAISEIAKTKGITQKVLIQVNIAEEDSKYGFSVKELKEHFSSIMGLSSISITGLMTMAPFTEDKDTQRKVFKGLKELKDYLEKEYTTSIPELSMGMSNDYGVAYEEGATIIRIGHAIFDENIN